MPTLVVDQVLTGTELGLSLGLSDLLVLNIGGRTVLYALSRTEGALVEVEIVSDGSLVAVGSLALNGGFAVGSDPAIAEFSAASGLTYLAIAGLPASAGQTVSLAADGALGVQAPLAAAGTLVAPASLSMNGTEALLTGQPGSGGLDLLTDSGSGLAFTAALMDASDRYLADIAASVSFEHSGTFYLASASANEDGINLAEVTATTLVQSDALGALDGMPINTPTELALVQRLGETLLVIGSFNTSSLSVASVTSGGSLQLADHVLDSVDTRFQAPSALDAFVYGDFAFAAAGGADGGVSLFTVLPGGRLVHLETVLDDASTTFYRASSIEMVQSVSRLNLLVSSAWEPGITRLGYDLSGLGAMLISPATGGTLSGTSSSDQLIGSDVADSLIGGAGDDIIWDGAGQDILTGGAGADLFVLHPDGQSDTITDFDRTADELDLSAFDFLNDISQVTISPTGNGAVLTYGAETLNIVSADATPLSAADFSNATILNVDRPPFLPIAQILSGSPADDTLNGAAGNDTISGAEGDDRLTGQAGDDTITGGAGSDHIDGGAGADTLRGEAGGDTLVGGFGDDILNGGAGDDVIYGEDWLGG
ncbi:MAG: hypothetical protein HKP35_10250 [Silicimonas sp.]|nr:hypothetical protein [Silicimonas sp.]